MLNEVRNRVTPWRVTEAAPILGRHPHTIWRLIRVNEIESIRMGRSVLIPAGEVRRLLGMNGSAE